MCKVYAVYKGKERKKLNRNAQKHIKMLKLETV